MYDGELHYKDMEDLLYQNLSYCLLEQDVPVMVFLADCDLKPITVANNFLPV